MPAKRFPLRKIREVLRLRCGLFPLTPFVASVDRPLPDWNEVARELGR